MTHSHQAENQSRFDQIAAQWDESPRRAATAIAVAEAIAAAVPLSPHWRALEYGCGTGLVGVRLLAQLQHLTAADLSPGMLTVLREKIAAAGLKGITPQVLDLTSAPPPPERYDFIFTSMTLHHIPDVGALLRTFASMLEPEGWVALADLDAEDGGFHGPDVAGIAHRGFERAALQRWLQAAGFRSVTFRTAHIVEKEREGEVHRYPVFLATAQHP
jgi:ubiquinone/menaquinone biosynthesis C-methylase UbiE